MDCKHQAGVEAGSARRRASWLFDAAAVVIIFCFSALLCFIVYDDPRTLGSVYNSDILLPASFFWNLWHDPDSWTSFQLARVPSIFPDLVVYGVLDKTLGGFRAAIFGYSVFQFFAFACAAGAVAGQVAHTRFVHAAALVLVLIAGVMFVELKFEIIGLHFEILATMEHFGAFLMSLVAVALLMALIESWREWLAALLAICCFLAFLSDRLFMFDFVLPAGGTLLVLRWVGRVSRSRAAAIVSRIAIGLVLAVAADHLLSREPIPKITQALSHAMRFFAETPAYLHSVGVSAIISIGVPYLVFAAYPFIRSWAPTAAGDDRHGLDRSAMLLWCFAAFAIVCVFALTAAVYADQGSYRYLAAAVFWPLIFVVIAALQIGGRHVVRFGWCVLLSLGVVFAAAAGKQNFVPATATWRDALATCLLQQRDRLGLKAGIAEYWLARTATVGSNWRVQIDQVTGDAAPLLWGNNPRSYRRSIQNPAQAPDYNFIVVDKLDSAAVLRKFGQPQRSEPCGSYTLWIYAEPFDRILLDQTR